MSDANSGSGLDDWFSQAQEPAAGEGQAAAPIPDVQPTQQIMPEPVPAEPPTAQADQTAWSPRAEQPTQMQPPVAPNAPYATLHNQTNQANQANQAQPAVAADATQAIPVVPAQPAAAPAAPAAPTAPQAMPDAPTVYWAPQGAQQQPQIAPQPQPTQQPQPQPYYDYGQQTQSVPRAQPFAAQPPQQPFGPGMGLPADDAGGGWESPKQPRRTKLAVATGVGVAGIIGLVTLLVVNQTGGTANAAHTSAAAKPTPKPTPSGFQASATTPAGDAKQMADAFLTAWQSGDLTKAAAYTDDPAGAQSVLSAYRSGLSLRGLELTAKSATAAGVVTFSVSAAISSTGLISANGGSVTSEPASTTTPSTGAAAAATTPAATDTSASGTWAYTSHLTAYKKNGGWYVKWDPTLVAPDTSATVHPVALAVAPGAAKVTDASGDNLADSSQAALQSISTLLKKTTKSSQGTAGLEVVLESSSGKIVSGSADKLSDAVSTGVVKTTIDPSMETLATTAVGQFSRSSMVVLRPSTGAILAVANSSGTSDIALTGTLAPGSSMKVITTTGLLADGMLPNGIYTHVSCPLVEDVQGVKIHNSTDSPNSLSGTEDYEPPSTPFSTDFSMSCNNAFTQWWQKMAGGKLADTASNYYGLNQAWDLGLGEKSTYFSMPSDQSGSELAEELYGQGLIEANPLSMASVAATVDTGQFHQPYLVGDVTDKATATPLPSSVKSQLYTVMREVITSGTASAVGFGSGVYGKTGTAEADANKDHNPNGWMIVFDPSKDLAIAAVVVDADFGAKTAGPEVNYVLKHS